MRWIAYLFTIVVLISCSDGVKDTKLSDFKGKEGKLEQIMKKLDKEEKGLLSKSLLRFGLLHSNDIKNGQIPDSLNHTIGELIEQQRDIEEENRIAEEKAKQERKLKEKKKTQLKNKMKKLFTVDVTDKYIHEQDYDDYIAMDLTMKNKSDKTIKGVKFKIEVTNMFGDDLGNFSFTHEEELPPKKSYSTTGLWDYNQFMDDDTRFKNTDFEKMTIVTTPMKIIFEDGTKLSLDDVL